MSNPIPNLLALTSIADGSPQQAAPLRNNYAAIQAAVNALATALKGGTAGALLYATDASDVAYLPDAPTDGQALIWNAAASRWKPGSAAGTTYRKTTAKTVNTTTADTDLLNGEITVAANALGTTGLMRLTAWGDYLNNASTFHFPIFSLKLGATPTVVLKTASAIDGTVSGNRFGWRVSAEILNLGATNTQIVNMVIHQSMFNSSGSGTASAPFATGDGILIASYGATGIIQTGEGINAAAIDTTAAMAVQLTVINPVSSASCETKLYGALAEIL